MNYLSIDYGTKNIGLAYSVNDIISPLPAIINNDKSFEIICEIIKEYSIDKVYVGISYGRIAKLTKKFIDDLSAVIKLPIETVDEAVSTIEASEIFRQNKNRQKDYKKLIDSVSAAVILHRVIN